MKKLILGSLISTGMLFAAITVNAQTNLLLNPSANSGTKSWNVFEPAAIEEFNGDKVFVIRNKGCFQQDVILTEDAVGKYALLIGRGASERINADGAITGLPYLYGYMMKSSKARGAVIYAYLQSQQMLAKASRQDEWVTMFGIFRVPEKTGAVRFFLNQAERNGVPQNGSAARFDDVGLYLFETEEDALQFAEAYKTMDDRTNR